jgi:SAM-dependent methyltransferase
MGNDYQQSAARYARRPQDVGTDSLVFRLLDARFRQLGLDGESLDVGCGAGRSTRFLQSLGLRTVGLDISEAMLEEARRADPEGRYVSYPAGAEFPFLDNRFGVVLSTWAVLEVATLDALRHLVSESSRVLHPDGAMFVATNTPEFYAHRWVSCEIDFPENRRPLRSGQVVTAMLLPERVQVRDRFWSDLDYRQVFREAGLLIRQVSYPTAPDDESGWLEETEVAPHIIYELVKGQASS